MNSHRLNVCVRALYTLHVFVYAYTYMWEFGMRVDYMEIVRLFECQIKNEVSASTVRCDWTRSRGCVYDCVRGKALSLCIQIGR